MGLQRLRTVTAHVPAGLGPVDRQAFLSACLKNIRKDQIKCVQDAGSFYRVTFCSEEAKDCFRSKGLSIAGCHIPIREADETRLVKLLNVPFEVPEENVITVLSRYGHIFSHTFERDKADGLFTGTRFLRMNVETHIPDRLNVLGYRFTVRYPGQPKLCHICQARGHLAAGCPNRGLCRICRSPGHVARNCPEKADSEPVDFAWNARRSRAGPPPREPLAVPESVIESDDASHPSAAAVLAEVLTGDVLPINAVTPLSESEDEEFGELIYAKRAKVETQIDSELEQAFASAADEDSNETSMATDEGNGVAPVGCASGGDVVSKTDSSVSQPNNLSSSPSPILDKDGYVLVRSRREKALTRKQTALKIFELDHPKVSCISSGCRSRSRSPHSSNCTRARKNSIS